MEFYTTIGEIVFYTMSVVGILMLVYSKAEGLFFGPLLLLAIDFTGYIETQQSYAYRFAMEQFKARGELDCGFLTEHRNLISIPRGWEHKEEIGFIKGDTIIDDEHCRVIDTEPPAPSVLLYVGIFGLSISIAWLLRVVFGVKSKKKKLPQQHRQEEESH
ncbi:MAG: hypothetical protein WCW84_10385 [Sulfurimonas sp.]|jgi:hypothetical protein